MATVKIKPCASSLKARRKGEGFILFGRSIVAQLRQIGKGCTAETYTTVLNSFSRFRQDTDVPLHEVCPDLMTAYEVYLKTQGICPNSISFYMRNLRAIYNRAAEKGLVMQRYPFRHVYTGIDKTVKRAVPLYPSERSRLDF